MAKEIEKIRHSLSHLLAQAVLELWPNTKLGIGPVIENGFYYDFEFQKPIKEEDLPQIEEKMKELISQNKRFVRRFVSKKTAQKIFKNQPYKLEILKDLKGEKVSVYQTLPGKTKKVVKKEDIFTDLCRGPHIKKTNQINPYAFKLTKLSGAYWKGIESNKMLTRIYGIAFQEEKELLDYLNYLSEAEKRDHRKLGKELDLFCFSELVGPGLPLFTPKGVALKEAVQKEVEEICRKYGFQKVSTPHFAKIELYEISGHAKKFDDELFYVNSKKNHLFVMKPVQCPHHAQIYASKPRSYRDLPIRYMESEKQYRAEKPGEVSGLTRVYAITVEDGHIFCTKEQVKNEIKMTVDIIKNFYTSLGLWGKHWVSLSTRGKDFSKYIGEKNDWDLCEKILAEISQEMNLSAKKCPGEAALYGPKLDFIFKDAFGKDVQIPTIQIDFATPKRFNLVYTDKDGKEKNVVMIHRAILGSYERFLALLIEYFAGAFPLWLSPIQVAVLPLSEKYNQYAIQIGEKLKMNNIRIQVNIENETLNKKIREAEIQKIPYLLIVGEKEIKNQTVSVRQREKGELGEKKLEDFIKQIDQEIKNKISHG